MKLWILLLGPLLSCGRNPLETLETTRVALISRTPETALRTIDEEYADTLGGRSQLRKDLTDIKEQFGRAQISFNELTSRRGVSELEARILGGIDADFVGLPTWKVRGAVEIDLIRRTDGFRIRSGLLTNFRGIRQLAAARKAALEANDAQAIRRLLHPRYRDGNLDADDAIKRLEADLGSHKVRLDVTHYRLELRGLTAHLDEHFTLSVNNRATPPLVGRFTLRRAAGRWRISGGLYPAQTSTTSTAGGKEDINQLEQRRGSE